MPRLPVAWVQVTAGLGFFLHSSGLGDSKDVSTYTLTGLAFFVGPLWDSIIGIKIVSLQKNIYLSYM